MRAEINSGPIRQKRGNGSQPRCPVLVRQRLCAAHLFDVAMTVQPIALEERQ
jgi:hypothetical protein